MTLDSELIHNAENGNLDRVRDLLQRGANVNAKDGDGETALTLASYHGHLKVVHALLNRQGVEVNIKNNYSSTALTLASDKGHLEVVRALLNHKRVEANIKTNHGNTALILASYWGNCEVVCALLDHDEVDVNIKDNDGNTALIDASRRGHLEVVRALLNHERVDVNIKNSEGFTALVYASGMGSLEVVRALLNHDGVDVNIKNNDGNTALIHACEQGHLEVVRAFLNHEGVDVNILNDAGITALGIALTEKNDDVARLLEEHMDRRKRHKEEEQKRRMEEEQKWREDERSEALEKEISKRRDDAARIQALEKELEKFRLEEEQKRRQEEDHKRLKEDERNRLEEEVQRRHEEDVRKRREEGEWNSRKHSVTPGDPTGPNKNSTSSDDTKIDQDRSKLLHVMKINSADPVELSIEYIERCIKKDSAGKPIKLGSGAYGDVFMAEDSRLPKNFAVKTIKPNQNDEDSINDIRKSFKKEISALKKFRHPNIIVLYGYSLNVNNTHQYLVYEFAAHGSLDNFFRDDGNRARLSAGIRLSIMFELARAVHFLHTGGCKVSGKGWIVYHRDIKSANICLAEDFTARIIDCGLAKFVPDETSNDIPGSVTASLRSTTGGPAFGTPGYMCPEYSRMKFEGTSCPYIAAFDVFSIGVVMVELILGCLTGGQSTRNGKQFENAFRRYVKDKRDRLIVDGWQGLVMDADPSIIWNPECLELVCKTAMRCLAPFPEDRLSTNDLLGELNQAIQVHAGLRNSEPERTACHGCPCELCNRNRASVKCSEGHALCSSCIEESLLSAPLSGIGGRQLTCLIDMCSGQPLQDKDLYRHINVGIFMKYIMGRELYGPASPLSNLYELLKGIKTGVDEVYAGQLGIKMGVDEVHAGQQGIKKDVDLMHVGQQGIKEGVDEVHAGQQDINKIVDHVQAGQKKLATGLNWALGALSLLTANEFKECPNLVVMTPRSVKEKNWSNPNNWVKWVGKQQFRVVFICAHSHQPGHEAFEISVTRKWIVKAAPWLKRCLQLLAFIADVQCIPFPIPNLSFLDQCKNMKEFYDSLKEEGTQGPLKTLEGEAFNVIAEKANENRSHWDGPMVSVTDENGAPIWVKGEYKEFYQVWSSGLIEI